MRRHVVQHGQLPKPNNYFHDTGNGEYQVSTTGVSYSDPRIGQYFDSTSMPDSPLDPPWLARDTGEVLEALRQPSFALVQGDLGAGKSTVLFGVRTKLRERGVPYVAINGHYLNQGKRIADAIRLAAGREQVVIYDSFDYPFIHDKKKQTHADRTRPLVTEAIAGHIADGGNVVATAHTDPWFSRFSTGELKDAFDAYLASLGASVHRVHGLLDETDAMAYVCGNLHGEDYGQAYPVLAEGSDEPTAHTYRVAKLVGKQVGAENIGTIDQVGFDATVRAIDAETRAKMGATPDYPLLPPSALR